MRTEVGWRPFALAAWLGAVALACTPSDAPRPDVVLITVDTLRADRLACYGAKHPATPHFDRIAAEGTLFERAAAPMPLTRPSHFSLFTSSYPRDHGVVNNKIALGAEAATLAAVFRDAGYRTAAVVGVRLLDATSGAARGFDHFDGPVRSHARSAQRVVSGVKSWLAADTTGGPFFLWVHFFDPHIPYAPAVSDGAAGFAYADWDVLLAAAEANGGDLPRRALDRAVALYDAEVAAVDRGLGDLLAALEARDLLERSIVTVTADHGECFENGIYFEHSDCLFEGAVRVPLLFRQPGSIEAGGRRSEVVELLDVAPTLLAMAGLPVPAAFQGRVLFGRSDAPRGAAFLQHPFYSEARVQSQERRLRSVLGRPTRPLVVGEEQVGLRTDEWKLILTGHKAELYHLASDPGERRDVAGERPDVVARLRLRVDAWRRAHPLNVVDPSQVNPELRQMLRELGYVR